MPANCVSHGHVHGGKNRNALSPKQPAVQYQLHEAAEVPEQGRPPRRALAPSAHPPRQASSVRYRLVSVSHLPSTMLLHGAGSGGEATWVLPRHRTDCLWWLCSPAGHAGACMQHQRLPAAPAPALTAPPGSRRRSARSAAAPPCSGRTSAGPPRRWRCTRRAGGAGMQVVWKMATGAGGAGQAPVYQKIISGCCVPACMWAADDERGSEHSDSAGGRPTLTGPQGT